MFWLLKPYKYDDIREIFVSKMSCFHGDFLEFDDCEKNLRYVFVKGALVVAYFRQTGTCTQL